MLENSFELNLNLPTPAFCILPDLERLLLKHQDEPTGDSDYDSLEEEGNQQDNKFNIMHIYANLMQISASDVIFNFWPLPNNSMTLWMMSTPTRPNQY